LGQHLSLTAADAHKLGIPGLAASVCYYGGAIAKFADEKAKCPMQMHFGEKDESILMPAVEEIKKKQPQAEIYVYPDAPHAFSNDDRASFRKEATDLSWSRTKEFLSKNMK
jgi:carboxymethylenebutenolidase